MTSHLDANVDRWRAHPRAASANAYARTAGVLLVLSIVAGGFGEMYVPSRLVVSADAAATAKNILASDGLFRLGFAGYLVEAVCDVALTLILYVLLRPVHKDLSLLAAFFRLVSTAVFMMTELLYFGVLLVLGGADYLKSFSPDQLNAIALLMVKVSGHGGGILMVFYGIAAILLGYLISRSRYLPWLLGALMALGGLGFVLRSLALVLKPAWASPVLFLPMGVAGLALAVWLLVRGVDAATWDRVTA